MALASLLLAALSVVSMVLALPTTPIPGVGAVFAFGAPLLAFAGIVAGGVAVSRGRRRSDSTGLAMLGTVMSVLSLFPALFTAVTCGLLNVLFTAGPIHVQRSVQVHVQSGSPAAGFGSAGQPDPSAPPPAATPAAPPVPGAPPPAFPPPPLAPKPPP